MGSERMKQKQQILPLLPAVYGAQLEQTDWAKLEELRLGTGRPMVLRSLGREQILRPLCQPQQLEEVLRRACRQSVYAYNDTVRQGYLTVPGGHRIGICGSGVAQQGGLQTIRAPSSLVIRVAHEVQGCADRLLPQLTESTLILGAPGSGKTTLLRDAVRQLSDKGRQWIGLADERGEVSAMSDGLPQLQIGGRTDVLVQVEKAEAVMMLLRTMSPQWIAMDEITAPGDLEALERAAYCGIRLLATAHGDSLQDLQRRPLYRKLLQTGVFRRAVLLRSDKTYTIEEVLP